MMENVNTSNFNSKVLNSSILTVVDFWAKLCDPCKPMAEILQRLNKTYNGKIIFYKLGLDEADNLSLANKYGIRAVPTLIVFKDGRILDKYRGLLKEDELKIKLDKLLRQNEEEHL